MAYVAFMVPYGCLPNWVKYYPFLNEKLRHDIVEIYDSVELKVLVKREMCKYKRKMKENEGKEKK